MPVGAARTRAATSASGTASKTRFRIRRSMSSWRRAKFRWSAKVSPGQYRLSKTVQDPSRRWLPLTCFSETQLNRRTGAGIANACASAAQPTSIVPVGTVFSWKITIGADLRRMRRKSVLLGENNHPWTVCVEIHHRSPWRRNLPILIESSLKEHGAVEDRRAMAQ